ncbi:MAG: SusD/RagB family nutrient-binding outer membrane lipoprotein [Parafilimonas sp.]
MYNLYKLPQKIIKTFSIIPKLVALIFIALLLQGCSKNFLDVNDDPNRVTDNNVTAELIFPAAEVAVGDLAVGSNAAGAGLKSPLQFSYNWIGYMAGNGGFAREYTETSYNIDFTFGDPLWQNYYNALFDLHQAKIKALATGDTALAGASLVLSAKLFQEVADTYGDVPYSQAFQVDKYQRTAYDKAADIYASLLKSLDTAIIYLSANEPTAFAPVDIINHGDLNKWIKFANTLRLRLLIRQSEVSGFNPAPEIAKIQNNGGVIGAGESINVNPGFANETNKQSQFYANYGYTPTGNAATTSWNANSYIVDILNNNNDPRISRFFTPVNGIFVGDLYGDMPGNIPAASASSYFGPGLIGSATQNQWILTSFESMFLNAEAIARGWLPGDAKSAYEAAVTESFIWLGVPDAATAASDYLQNTAIANWDNAGTTKESQAAFIVFQKYIAMCCIDPLEAWADQRRLHFLPPGFISVNTSKISNTLPVRLLYPQSEYTTNFANVSAEGKINQFTSKLFWQP